MLVEAGLLTPLLLLLIFGVIEMGLLFRDVVTVGAASRDGARVAAASGDELNADYRILQTIKTASSVISPHDVTRIVVFEATDSSSLPTPGCRQGTPSSTVGTRCNVYTGADFARDAGDFGCAATSPDRYWCPSVRPSSLGALGYVGIEVWSRHQLVTGFFGRSVQLKDRTVLRIEPKRV